MLPASLPEAAIRTTEYLRSCAAGVLRASGGLPISAQLRLGELVATFALAQDNAFGQPLESQLRSCLLAMWIADEAEFDPELRETVYWGTSSSQGVAVRVRALERERLSFPRQR
jgi:hypothetical protein